MSDRNKRRRCTSCGAAVERGVLICPYCRAEISDPDAEETLRKAAEGLIRGLDSDLRSYLPPWSIFIGAVAVGISIGLFLLLRHFGFGIAVSSFSAIVIAFFGLAGVGVSTEKAEARFFRNQVLPRIEKFSTEHNMSSEELIRIANETLTKETGGLVNYFDEIISCLGSH